MSLADPTAVALDVLARVEQPGWWSALPGLVHGGLVRWPGHPDLTDALISLALHDGFAEAQGHALIEVLVEAASAVRKADSAPLLAQAAQLAWIHVDAEVAFGHLVAALSADPHDPDARALLAELIASTDAGPVWADGLETLAMRAVRGDLERSAVEQILSEVAPVCACPRAWALLGR